MKFLNGSQKWALINQPTVRKPGLTERAGRVSLYEVMTFLRDGQPSSSFSSI